ncbi:uncharacterized protein LOC111246546 isoform X3 [Varroa destructor]|uniref:Uncharacterized protein n=1 Tax=Varroa destructor TaxID=109461 RepID=A0A7M7JH27_VARDE|nr:uncharacterized protein LOC111246546 isoform X3 [Varroa destructor]
MLRKLGTIFIDRNVLARTNGFVRNYKATVGIKHPNNRMMEQQVRHAAQELSKVLNCDEGKCLKLFRSYPELRNRTLSQILHAARMLKTSFDNESIIRYGRILARPWVTIQHQKYILEELGLQQVNLRHVIVFPYILQRTLYELKTVDKLIALHSDVLTVVVNQIPDCPRSLTDRLLQVLPAERLMSIPVAKFWAIFMTEYLKGRLKVDDSHESVKAPNVVMQSVRLMDAKLNILQKILGLDLDTIRSSEYFLTLDTFNLQALVDRVDTLSSFTLADLARKEPSILSADPDNICKVESILEDHEIMPQQVWCHPQVYLYHANLLSERFSLVNTSVDIAMHRESLMFLRVLTNNWDVQRENIGVSNLKLQATNDLIRYLQRRLKIVDHNEKMMFATKLRLHKTSLLSSPMNTQCSATVLLGELSLSKEQIMAAPGLLLHSQEVLREGWAVLQELDYIKELGLGKEWRKFKFAGEMLLYEIECGIVRQTEKADTDRLRYPSQSIYFAKRAHCKEFDEDFVYGDSTENSADTETCKSHTSDNLTGNISATSNWRPLPPARFEEIKMSSKPVLNCAVNSEDGEDTTDSPIESAKKKVDTLLGELGFDRDTIQKSSFLYNVDISNLQEIIHRIPSLATFTLREIVREEPRILTAKVDKICEIEYILYHQRVTPEQVWLFPLIYVCRPNVLLKRFTELNKLTEGSVHRNSPLFLRQLVRNRNRLRDHELHALQPDLLKGVNRDFLKYVSSRLQISTKKQKLDLSKKLRLHQSTSIGGCLLTAKDSANFLISELGFSIEQIRWAPGLLLFNYRVLRQAWCNLRRLSYTQKLGLGDAWKKSKIVGEMLLYGIENDPELHAIEASEPFHSVFNTDTGELNMQTADVLLFEPDASAVTSVNSRVWHLPRPKQLTELDTAIFGAPMSESRFRTNKSRHCLSSSKNFSHPTYSKCPFVLKKIQLGSNVYYKRVLSKPNSKRTSSIKIIRFQSSR